MTVTPNPANVAAGETVQLTATLRDAAGATLTGRTVTWSSGATQVATVDEDGLVTGVAEGPATISAESEGQSGSTALTVAAVEPPPGGPGVVACRSLKDLEAEELRLMRMFPTNEEWTILDALTHSKCPAGGTMQLLGTLAPGLSRTMSRPAAAAEPPHLLIAAGSGANEVVSVRTASLLNVATQAATELEMVAKRVYHTATKLPNDRLLFVGGDSGIIAGPGTVRTLSSAEIFDLASEQFTATGSMSIARARHAAAPLPDGRVLVTGGLTPDGGGPNTIDVASAEIFDPATGTFSSTGSMTVTRFNHSAIALDDGRILVLGGNGRRSAEVYDAGTGAFSPVGDMEVNHGLGHRAVKLTDGRVLVVAGDGGTIQPTAVAEVFDPGTDEFTRVGDLTTTRMLHFAVLLEDTGEVLVGGGQDATGDLLASSEIFDPVTNAFRAIGDMPNPASEQAAAWVPE